METQQTSEWDLDEATVNLLIDRFYWREICDDERMERYWNRTLANVRNRYKDILRVETIKFDPLVSKYFEGEYTTTGSTSDGSNRSISNTKTFTLGETGREEFETEMFNQETGSSTNSSDGRTTKAGSKNVSDDTVISNTSSYNDSKNVNGSNGGTSTVASQTHETVANQSNSSDVSGSVELNRQAVKAAPMNASGVTLEERGTENASIDGMLADLDFDYASSYQQADKQNKNESAHNEAGSSQTNGSGNSTTTDAFTNQSREALNGSRMDNGSNDRTIAQTDSENGTSHDEGTGSYADNGKDWGTSTKITSRGGQNIDRTSGTDELTKYGSSNLVKRDRYTGRDGVLPQDAMRKAIDFLESYSNAFEWLCNKLEINFIGIYDI